MYNRTSVLNHLAKKYRLDNYLEIGLQRAEQNFNKIICSKKISVDPDAEANATWQMTSDEFFKGNFWHGFMPDLVLIDGLHTAEQVKKDFKNSLKILSPNGFIVLHDCNPDKEEHTIVPRPTKTGHYNGDVYKFAANIWTQIKVTVDIDNGCCVVKPDASRVTYFTKNTSHITWGYFDAHRKELLNLISWEEFVNL